MPACQGQSKFSCDGSSIGIIGFSGHLNKWQLTLVNDFADVSGGGSLRVRITD